MIRIKRSNAELPTGSTSDIAFLLLVFFVVITTVQTDKGIGLVLPAEDAMARLPARNLSSILMNKEGAILMDDELCPITQIRERAMAKLSGNSLVVFSVQTSKRTPYAVFVLVLDQLRQAGAEKIV
ncbi:MAG: biopolymer transporter ExbD, partial [Bacteroidetes bacterium]|nr:biopolymer transporter ExbD [Bacteroidota bacterium]